MWKLKALAQFVFAHLPYGEQINHLAQHARGTFKADAQLGALLTQAEFLRRLNERFPLSGTTVIEIGPGWMGNGLILFYLFGASRIHAYDHQPHLRLPLMQGLARIGRENLDALALASGQDKSLLAARLDELLLAQSLPQLLETASINYVAPGDATKTGLPYRSVDLVFSYGVLEHVPYQSLEAIMAESERILKLSGRACHNVGLHDHFHDAGLGNGVNFLRYSEAAWAFFCYNKILYHNRLRYPEFLALFNRYGLDVIWDERELLEINLDALRKLKVDEKFRGMSEQELATSHLFVDLVPKAARQGPKTDSAVASRADLQEAG